MKKKDEKERKDIKEKINQVLELPGEIILDVPKLVLIGNKNLTIENYKGIIEYSDKAIRINTKLHMIKVTGEKLEIKTITEEDMYILGNIETVEFIS